MAGSGDSREAEGRSTSDMTSRSTRLRSLDRALLEVALVVALFTVFDAVATTSVVTVGIAAEGNPVWSGLVHGIGPASTMALRVIVGLALIAGLVALVDRSRLAWIGLQLSAVALALVCAWHFVGLGLAIALL